MNGVGYELMSMLLVPMLIHLSIISFTYLFNYLTNYLYLYLFLKLGCIPSFALGLSHLIDKCGNAHPFLFMTCRCRYNLWGPADCV